MDGCLVEKERMASSLPSFFRSFIAINYQRRRRRRITMNIIITTILSMGHQILSGRMAGRKAVIIKQSDEGTKERPYPHAIVAGVDRYPRKVTKRMGAKKVSKRSKVKPFVKVGEGNYAERRGEVLTVYFTQSINYNHIMPTRYALELDALKGALSADTMKESSQREDAMKNIKKVFEQKYQAGQNKWFFTPLRVGGVYDVDLDVVLTFHLLQF